MKTNGQPANVTPIRPSNLPRLRDLQSGEDKHEWNGLQALGRYIILSRIDVGNDRTPSGILIPENAQMPAWVAVSVGPDVVGVKQWDRVLMIYKQPDCVVVNHEGRDFMICPFELAGCVLPMPDPDAKPKIIEATALVLQ